MDEGAPDFEDLTPASQRSLGVDAPATSTYDPTASTVAYLAGAEEEAPGHSGRVVDVLHPLLTGQPLVMASTPSRYGGLRFFLMQDLRYLLSHPECVLELLQGSEGAPPAFSWWLHASEWLQHMAPLQRDGHEQPYEEDEPQLPWVHGFCLELELISLLPALLEPLVAPAEDD